MNIIINYLHKAVFSPTKSAFLKAVKKGNFTTWPGMREAAINTHLKMKPATAMGHLHQMRQKNVPPTKKRSCLI
jgi:hypothetical protein